MVSLVSLAARLEYYGNKTKSQLPIPVDGKAVVASLIRAFKGSYNIRSGSLGGILVKARPGLSDPGAWALWYPVLVLDEQGSRRQII